MGEGLLSYPNRGFAFILICLALAPILMSRCAEAQSIGDPPKGVNFSGSSASVSWAKGRLDIFVAGNDGGMYHKFYDKGRGGDNAGDWESIGLPTGSAKFTGSPAAVSWGPDRLDIFATGTDEGMYHKFYDSGWGGGLTGDWESIGLPTGNVKFAGSPAAVSWGPDRLDIFATGTDGCMYHKFYDSGWGEGKTGNWESIGLPAGSLKFAGSPAAVSWGLGRLDIFATGTDGGMYHKFYDGGWGGGKTGDWEPIGLPAESLKFAGSPAAVSWGPGRLDIFATGADGGMYHKFYDGDWSNGLTGNWESMGLPAANDVRFANSPAAVSGAKNHLEVFAPGTDGRAYSKIYDSGWGGGPTGDWALRTP